MAQDEPQVIDLKAYVRPGDRLMWGQAAAEPCELTGTLAAQAPQLGGIEALIGLSVRDTFTSYHSKYIRFLGFGGFGTNVRLVDSGAMTVVPVHASAVGRLISEGILKVDVLLLLVTRADRRGCRSLGLTADYLQPAIKTARVGIAEESEHVPWTFGDTLVEAGDLDVVVQTDTEPAELRTGKFTDAERTIGDIVAQLIPDGATIQFGFGTTPDAVAIALRHKRHLGVHSGIVTDSVLELIRSGAITNENKVHDRGVSVAGVVLGSRGLYDFVHRNRAFKLRQTSYTHSVLEIARIPQFVSVNSALEIDLTGQVNSEVAEQRHVGAVGGAADFVRGAMLSSGGRSIVALPATARGNQVSRIVGRLTSPVVTIPRSDVDCVVTEYGVAELRGASLAERAKRLIAIAHPAFRDGLGKEVGNLC